MQTSSATPGTTTIKDISKALNVSSTTVHRALTGKEGISDSLRKKILMTAQEMGYIHNYAASAIKRKAMRIAVVLPTDRGNGTMYYSYFWKGYRDYMKEIAALNVVAEEFVVGSEAQQAQVLKEIADQGPEAYHGVLTYSYTRNPQVMVQFQRLTAQKIAVVVLDDQLEGIDGLYCISPSDKTIGQLCAEFLSLTTPEEGTIVLTGGRQDSKVHDNTTRSFIQFMAQCKPGIQVIESLPYEGDSQEDAIYQEIYKTLALARNLVGIFCLTSRENEPMVRALEDLGLAGKVRTIGSDLYKKSAQRLEAGVFHAIIYKNPYDKGYVAMRILTDLVVKHIVPPPNTNCIMSMLFKSSLIFYKDVIEP